MQESRTVDAHMSVCECVSGFKTGLMISVNATQRASLTARVSGHLQICNRERHLPSERPNNTHVSAQTRTALISDELTQKTRFIKRWRGGEVGDVCGCNYRNGHRLLLAKTHKKQQHGSCKVHHSALKKKSLFISDL